MTSSAQSRFSAIRNAALAITCGAVVAGCQSTGGSAGLDPDNTSYKRMVTQGLATKIIVENVYPGCPQHTPRMNIRKSAVGQITATDGTVITVPAETAAQKGLGPKSYDLYNECTQVTPANTAAVSTANVPVIEVDADGEVITGFIVADNYYEMYVNGKLVSVDNTPYTPFNSAIVKFKVKRPYTLAFLLVDWDERLGLGMEQFPVPVTPTSSMWYPGDGGLIAKFSDGTMTDATWKAQTFFIGAAGGPEGSGRARQRARHAEPRRPHAPVREQAHLRGQVLRRALPDSGQLAVAALQRHELAARLGIHRPGNRRH